MLYGERIVVNVSNSGLMLTIDRHLGFSQLLGGWSRCCEVFSWAYLRVKTLDSSRYSCFSDSGELRCVLIRLRQFFEHIRRLSFIFMK